MEAAQLAFAMMSLAIATAKLKREDLETLPKGMSAGVIPTTVAVKLRERVASGDVTCVVPNVEPFTAVYIMTGPTAKRSELRCVWGLWIGRQASWKGTTRAPLQRLGVMTPDEARAKGIPVPDFMPVEKEG